MSFCLLFFKHNTHTTGKLSPRSAASQSTSVTHNLFKSSIHRSSIRKLCQCSTHKRSKGTGLLRFGFCRDSQINCLWAPVVSFIVNYLVTQIWDEVDPGEISRGPELAPKKRPTFAYPCNHHVGSGRIFFSFNIKSQKVSLTVSLMVCSKSVNSYV